MFLLLPCRLRIPAVQLSLRLCLSAVRRGESLESATTATAGLALRRNTASLVTFSAIRLSPRGADAPARDSVGRFSSKHHTAAPTPPPPPGRGVGGGPLHPESADPFQPQPRRRMDLKLGPYAGGRFFVSPREDPKEFVLCVAIVAIFLYTLISTYTQPGKAYTARTALSHSLRIL